MDNGPIIVSTEGKKGISTTTILIGAGAILLLLYLFGRGRGAVGSVPDASTNAADEDAINNVLDSDLQGDYLLPADTSPVVIPGGSAEMSEQEVIALVDSISAKYSAQAEAMALNLSTTVENVLTAGVVILAEAVGTGSITEEGMDLYWSVMEVWSKRFDNAVTSVSRSIADTAAASVEGINNAVECSETILVKEVFEESTLVNKSHYSVTIKNGGTDVLMGILGSSKSSSEVRTGAKSSMRNDVRKITYVPTCVDWQLDPTQFAAIMANTSLSTQLQYGILQAVANMAPVDRKSVV